MKTIAIIPARGNSRRLPNKNIKLLGEIPLLVHSINYAKQNDFIDAIYVTTDNKEIKETIENVKYAIKVGYMHKDSVHTSSDYEVVQIKFSETDDHFVTYHLDGVQERVSSVSEWENNLGIDVKLNNRNNG